MELRAQTCVGDTFENFLVGVLRVEGDFEGVEESSEGGFGDVETVC